MVGAGVGFAVGESEQPASGRIAKTATSACSRKSRRV